MPSPQNIFEGNARLSEEYLQSVSLTTVDITAHQPLAKAIRNAPVDIAAYFAEHGTLEGLNAPGIGTNTRVRLLPILERGIEAVLKLHSKPVDLPLDKTSFQEEARAAVKQHRDQIREEE
jgi:hypothetical protein